MHETHLQRIEVVLSEMENRLAKQAGLGIDFDDLTILKLTE